MRAPGRAAPQRVPTGYAEKASASGYRVNVAPKNADAEVEALGAQIIELLSRIRTVEESLAESEQRADEAEDIALELEEQLNNATQLAETNARAAASAQRPVLPRLDDVDVTPRKSSGGAWFPWLLCVLLLGGAAAAFVLVYQPMLQKLQAAEKQNQDQTGQHTQELSTLRASFAEERSRLESQLAAAQSAAAAAPAAATAAPAAEAAAPAAHEGKSGHASDAAEARAAKAEEKKAERAAKREERLAKKAEQKAERSSAKKSEAKKSSDDSDEEKPKKPSAPSSSDDPLEGM